MDSGSPSAAEKTALLQRVLESNVFSKAPRRREFLRYICEQTIAGRSEPVHEREIGVEVYHRPADYDSGEDNIVRVEARNLRKQLDQFFGTEGHDESVVIQIPKGSYIPVFEARAPSAESPPVAVRPPPARSWSRGMLALAGALGVCAVLLLARSVGPPKSDAEEAVLPTHPLWSSVFDPARETYLVVADSNFASLQTYMGRTLTLQDYLEPGFGLTGNGMRVSEVVERFSSTPATSFADLALAVRIMQLPWAERSRTTIRFARDINVRDFKDKNAILLGSICSNPWAELWQPQLNFRIKHDHESNEAWIHNVVPESGEWGRYAGSTESSYGVVALLPNLGGNGSVLLLAGIGMDGTEAAGELVTRDRVFRAAAQEMGLVSNKRLLNFEAVIEFSSVQGAPAEASQIVAHRVIPPATAEVMQPGTDSVWPETKSASP